jgi:ribosome-binding factor A
MPSDRRKARLHEFIRRYIGELIDDEVAYPGILVSITNVETSPDVQWADISVSVFPYNRHEEVMALLQKKAGFLQSLFNKKLRIRHTPKIRFKLDSRMEAGLFDETEDDSMGM